MQVLTKVFYLAVMCDGHHLLSLSLSEVHAGTFVDMHTKALPSRIRGEKDVKFAQNLGQVQPLVAVFAASHRNAWANLHLLAYLAPFSLDAAHARGRVVEYGRLVLRRELHPPSQQLERVPQHTWSWPVESNLKN